MRFLYIGKLGFSEEGPYLAQDSYNSNQYAYKKRQTIFHYCFSIWKLAPLPFLTKTHVPLFRLGELVTFVKALANPSYEDCPTKKGG